jgi:hypothetical protein
MALIYRYVIVDTTDRTVPLMQILDGGKRKKRKNIPVTGRGAHRVVRRRDSHIF